MTRPGIEGGPNVTKHRSVTVAPTKADALERPAATFGCNECNEMLDAARATVRAVRRLAVVATNALANGDVTRARTALGDLNEVLIGFDSETERGRLAKRFR